jgi:pimeloyl-ACP methyl ester carboxylesterase
MSRSPRGTRYSGAHAVTPSTWHRLPTMLEHRFADLEDIRLHYVIDGPSDAEPIVFLHGFPEYWGVWKQLLAAFAPTHRVIAPDLRGANQSGRPEDVEAYRIERLVGDVLGLLDRLELPRVTLVAQDWGSLVGWSFLLRHRERVARYVTINVTHPALFDRDLRENPAQQQASAYMLAFRAQGEALLLADGGAFADQAIFADARAHGAVISAEDEAEWKALLSEPGHVTAGLNYYRAAEIGPPDGKGSKGGSNVVDGLRAEDLRVDTPVLVIRGDGDPYLLPSGLDGLEKLAPNSRIVHIPEATHWVSLEHPERVTALVREFVGG